MPLNFMDVIDAAPDVDVISAPLAMSGLTLGTKTIAIVGVVGTLAINGGSYVTSGVVQNGDTVTLKVHTVDSQLGEVATVTVNIESVGYVDWSVTNINNLLSDSGNWYEVVFNVTITAGQVMSDTGVWTETPYPESFTFIQEVGTLVDAAYPNVHAVQMLDEDGRWSDAGIPDLSYTAADATGHWVDSTPGSSSSLVADEVGVWTETGLPVALISVVASDATGSWTETASPGSLDLLTDATGTWTETPLFGSTYYNLATDAGTFSDWASGLLTANALVVDEVAALSDWASTIGVYTLLQFGGAGAWTDEAIFDNPVGRAWVFNSRSLAMSRWEELQITEVHQAPDGLYGLSPSGIYRLSDTLGTNAAITTGLYNFGKTETKQLDHAYFTYQADTPLEVDAILSLRGAKTSTTYRQPAINADTPRQSRLKFGRGRQGVYWGFVLRNTSQGNVIIQDGRIVPLVSRRRI